MAIDEAAAVNEVVREHLEKIAFTDKEVAGYAVGPMVGPVLDPATGQMNIAPAWVVTVTLPSPLLGQPKIAKSGPLPGPRPTDESFRAAVRQALDECRLERDKLETIPRQMTLPFPQEK